MKEPSRARRYQLRQQDKGMCGVHPKNPIDPSSKISCLECLASAAARRKDMNPHRTIWEKIVTGEATSLSASNIHFLKRGLEVHGIFITKEGPSRYEP